MSSESNRPSDAAIAQAFWEARRRMNAEPSFLLNPEVIRFGDDITRRARSLDGAALSPPSSATPGGRQAPPNDQWCIGCTPKDCSGCGPRPQEAACCTCPSGDGSLRWPCPKHPTELYPQPQERAYTDHCDFNAASSGDPACTCQPQERAGSEAGGAWKQPVVCTCHTERQRELCMQRKECVVAYATGNQVKATRPQPASDTGDTV